MELRARVEKLTRAQAPTAVPPTSNPVRQRLVSLEQNQVTHCWLRGMMAFLAFLCSILSLFQVSAYVSNVVLHSLILALSLMGEVCIVLIYHIKARFAGVTNPASHTVNLLHSPHLSLMLCEMVVWIIMTPPGVTSTAPWAQMLDSLIVLRSYVYVLYFTRLSTQSVFKRAVASLCGYRFTHLYLFRTTFVFPHAMETACGFTVAWLGLAMLYSKAEEVSYADAVYFCSSTMGFVGYSDVAPSTLVGRFTAFLAWCLGLLVIAWCVSMMHALIRVSPAERNLYTLFHTNKLCAQVPGEAARTVQRAWKLFVAKREKRNQLSIQFNALLLSHQASSFRALRREFFKAEMAFLRSTYTFDDTLTALSRQSSRGTTPSMSPRSPGTPCLRTGSGTPRSASFRRSFSLFREMKIKSALTSPSPRSVDSRASHADSAGAQPSVPPLKLHDPLQGMHHPSSNSTGASALSTEITMRLARLEENLSVLVNKAERMAPRGLLSSTEVAS
ncbi:hypothetical protein JKF63_06699 [Porcisia hertigi]|uniref:Potassium channel domain-containing protein n=1 Tax=Porcisia hertigi TaxID=2761500 RepID=A0A836LET4_9TRYP|nr:hypothetical protein JKF63_06699 [Porcisia hertigi]